MGKKQGHKQVLVNVKEDELETFRKENPHITFADFVNYSLYLYNRNPQKMKLTMSWEGGQTVSEGTSQTTTQTNREENK